MQNILTPLNSLWLFFFLSAALLLGALGFQHIGELPPCTMCYWQRHAHKAVMGIAALGLFLHYFSKSEKWNKIFLILIGLAFLVSFGLAFAHVGVEHKWWAGPKICASTNADFIEFDPDKLFSSEIRMPSCEDIAWSMFGISMAGYNALVSIGAAVLSFIIVFKRH
ncbi:MAG: disulfide bond formation protein B [Robiginitomaculum sp.]